MSSRSGGGKSKGGVDPAEFESAMFGEDPISLSAGDLADEAEKLMKLLKDSKADWEKRVAVCKRFRGIVEGGGDQLPSFIDVCTEAADAFASGAKDLRSQVSKETCITLSRISHSLGVKFEPIAKVVLPVLLRQVAINVKVLAESASLGVEHILKTCHSHRLIAAVCEMARDRAVSIRRKCFGFCNQVIRTWPADKLKKQLSALSVIVIDGQNDADAEVRMSARASYWAFNVHFSAKAAELLKKLDPSKQKQLMKDKDTGGGVSGASAGPAKAPKKRVSKTPAARKPPVSKTPSERKAPAPAPATSTATATVAGAGRTDTGAVVRKTAGGTASGSGAKRFTAKSRPSSAERAGDRPATGSSGTSKTGPARLPVKSAGGTAKSAGGARRVPGPATSKAPRATAVSPPAPKGKALTFGEALAEAVRLAESSDWSDRMEAITLLNEQVRGSSAPSEREVVKVTEYFSRQFGEPNRKVFATVMDTMCDFIVVFKEDIPDTWIRDCLAGLLLKLGGELAPATEGKVVHALELFRSSFSGRTLLLAVFRMMKDKSQAQNSKVKTSQMEFITRLVPTLDPAVLGTLSGSGDTADALLMMVGFCSEPRSADLRREAAQVMVDLVQLDTDAFCRILEQIPVAAQDATDKVLINQLGANWRDPNATGASDIVEDVAPLPPAATSSSGKRTIHRLNSTDAFDLAAAEGSDGETPEPAPDIGYDPAVYADVLATSGSPPRSQRASPAVPAVPSASPSPLVRAPVAEAPPVAPLKAPAAASPVYQPNAGPAELAQNAVAAAREELEQGDSTARDATRATLEYLVTASKENSPEVWSAEQFDDVLSIILDVLNDADSGVRDLSLKMLRAMLKNQTGLFEQSITLVVSRLLERHTETDRQVLRSVEETLSVLSNVIIPTTCVRILEPIILGDDGSVLLAAITMLTKVLQKMSRDEMSSVTDICIPGIVKAYKHPMAEVRKGVVFALVEMYLTIGPPLMNRLDSLSSSQRKLLGIYIKRAEDRIAAKGQK